MMVHKSWNGALQAISPFMVGETEILLIPNQLNGSPPSVMMIARHRGRAISSHLSPADMRRLGKHLQAAADEAEALARFHSGQ